MKLPGIFLLVLCLFLKTSCFKQKPKEIRGEREPHLLACRQANFVKDILKRNNLVHIFECTKWDKRFPKILNAIKNVPEADWNHLVGPINEGFLNNLESRNHIFSLLKGLDKKRALDDLGRVITSLNDTNFYDALALAYRCAEKREKDLEKCRERNAGFGKRQALEALGVFDVEASTFDVIIQIVEHSIEMLTPHQKRFKEIVRGFFRDEKFVRSRTQILDALFSKFYNGGTGTLDPEDISFLKAFFLQESPSGEVWVHQWLNSLEGKEETFRDFFRYSYWSRPNFLEEFRVVDRVRRKKILCTPLGKDKYGLEVNLEKFANDLMSSLVTGGRKAFFKKAIEDVQLQLFMTSGDSSDPRGRVCPEVKHLSAVIPEKKIRLSKKKSVPREKTGRVDFLDLINSVTRFLSNERNYEMVKFLLSASDSLRGGGGHWYLLKMLTGDLYESILTNLEIIDPPPHGSGYLDLLFDLFRLVDKKTYHNILSLILRVSSDQDVMKGMYHFWSFLSVEEKNFLFNFFDTHIREETNYLALLGFYADLMKVFKRSQKLFYQGYLGSADRREKTYHGIGRVANQFQGDAVLREFKRFFSRDHILRTIKVITRGSQFVLEGELELSKGEDKYLDGVSEGTYRHKVLDNDKGVLRCLNALALQNNIYETIAQLPKSCAPVRGVVTNELIAELAAIERQYRPLRFSGGARGDTQLFDSRGLLSPRLVNGALTLAIVINEKWKGTKKRPRSGIRNFFNQLSWLFFESGENLIKTISDIVFLYNFSSRNLKISSALKSEEQRYRNQVYAKIFDPVSGVSFARIFKDGLALAKKYVMAGGKGAKITSPRERDDQYSCSNYLNGNIGIDSCPGKDVIKRNVKTIVSALQRRNDPKRGVPTGGELLMRALSPEVGLRIPLIEGKARKRYFLSLRETLQIMYDFTDKNYTYHDKKAREVKVNRHQTDYTGRDKKTSKQEMMTSERIEVTIREVRFAKNFLGAHFKNTVAKSKDYLKDVKAKYSQLKLCVSLGWCMKSKLIKGNRRRMAKNALEAYPGLIDAERVFGRKDYMRALVQVVVGSSAVSAQKSSGFLGIPYINTDDQLDKHNGVILVDLAELGVFSHAGRALHERLGRTRSEFLNFVNSEDMRRIDRMFINGVKKSHMASLGLRVMWGLERHKDESGNTLLDKVIDYFYDLSSDEKYEKLRALEGTLYNILRLGSYLGPPSLVRGKRSRDSKEDIFLEQRYGGHSLFDFLNGLDKLIKHWPVLFKSFPKEKMLIDALRVVSRLTAFLSNEIEGGGRDLRNNRAYRFLNELYLLMKTYLFDTSVQSDGFAFLTKSLAHPSYVKTMYQMIGDVHRQLSNLWFKPGGLARLSQLGENARAIVDDMRLNSNSLVDYFRSTTVVGDSHYDEIASLFSFFGDRQNPRLSRYLETLFRKRKERIISFLEENTSGLTVVEDAPSSQ